MQLKIQRSHEIKFIDKLNALCLQFVLENDPLSWLFLSLTNNVHFHYKWHFLHQK